MHYYNLGAAADFILFFYNSALLSVFSASSLQLIEMIRSRGLVVLSSVVVIIIKNKTLCQD